MTTENKVRIAAVVALTVLLSAGAGFGGGYYASALHPGPPGPQGRQGEQGSTGPPGARGSIGPAGSVDMSGYTCYSRSDYYDSYNNPLCLLGRRLR